MKTTKNAALGFIIIHCFVSMAIAEAWQLDTNACVREYANVLLFIDKGMDINKPMAFAGVSQDYYVNQGPDTLLRSAVSQNCAGAVRLLLEHGADPNVHGGDLTPLLSNLLNLSTTSEIADETLREQARAPMREIRALLLSYGAYCDSTLYRRWFINDFRKFLFSTNGQPIYVLCMTNQIIIDDQDSVQQFDVPYSNGSALSGFDLNPILASVLEAQKAISNVTVQIIGVKDVAYSVGTLYREQGIPENTFAIPDHIAADAKTLTDLFLGHPDAFTEDMMRLLDEVSPQSGRMNPLADSEAELLAL